MIRGDRIRERLDALDRSQGWLAREVDLSPQAISKMIAGGTADSPKLYQIARALETSVEFLTGETDDRSLALAEGRAGYRAEPLARKPRPEIVGVREIDLSFGMGATYLDIPVTETVRHFSRDWLRQFTTADPDMLLIATGVGDSMWPTIHNNDTLIIDISQRHINVHDRIWAIAYANCGAIRRIRPKADGTVEMLCDNELVPNDIAADGEMTALGRVVAAVRKF